MATEWKMRWGKMVAMKPSRPGIYRVREGGYLVRGRITEPQTGKRTTIQRYLPDATVELAQVLLDELKEDTRNQLRGLKPQKQRFSEYAASLFEGKVEAGDIRSAKGREKWEGTLRNHLFPAFGEVPCDEITAYRLKQWRKKVGGMIARGYESNRRLANGQVKISHVNLHPQTANTWLRILKTICAEMTDAFDLHRDPSAKIAFFDTSQHPTYTDENPNSVAPQKMRLFMAEVQRLYPQHYAMVLLGFATGKRPSTLRPLRAVGPEADVDWDEGFIRFRRSHTRGKEFMAGVKTGGNEKAHLPPYVLDALRTHRALLQNPPRNEYNCPPIWWSAAMARSELLFPSRTGGPRSPAVLDKLFQTLASTVGLPHLTPRSMRRTLNDLARAAEIDDFVTKSITGHSTDRMKDHYSTAQAAEQRRAIGSVVDQFLAADSESTAAIH